MIVLDTSAVIAILLGEPTAPALRRCLAADNDRVMSCVSCVEAGTVMSRRHLHRPHEAVAELRTLLAEWHVTLIATDAPQSEIALEARLRFGRGTGHPARLNLGDLFACALAKSRAAPLLFVGEDFLATDITPALAPR